MSQQQYEDSDEDPDGDPDGDRAERSIRLSQLIKDRKSYLQVSEEIKELNTQGVDINHQDFHRHNNTYLHLSVSNFDVKCVEYLLKFKPRLDIKNTFNETPIEMAQRLAALRNRRTECREILRLLLNATSLTDSLHQTFIHEFTCKDLSKQKIDAIRQNPSFKVLRIKDCPSIDELFRTLQTDNLADVFRETTNFFFIDIYVSEQFDGFTEGECKTLNLIFPQNRPLIIQVTHDGFDPMIYYKEENSVSIKKIQISQHCISEDELMLKVLSKDECNFNLLLQALQLNKYGELNKDILDTKLHKNDDRNRLANLFASKNSLCLRFLKLFEETLDVEQWSERVSAVMKCHEDVSCLLAFLDHPFNVEDRQLRLSHDLREHLFRVDSRKYNLLMIAIEKNNVEAVKYFVRCGFNLNDSGADRETAVDLAWNYECYNCFAAIIQADSHFPLDFDVERISFGVERETIEKTLKEKEDFLISVESGNLEDVKEYVESNPQVKSCYSTINKSALTVALEFEKYEVYSFLRSEGFSFSAEHDFFFDEFYAKSDKKKIRVTNRKHFYELKEPHLNTLLAKSRLSYGSKDRGKCYQIIRKMYSELNEIEEISAILKLIVSSEKLEIIFDFNLNNVLDMDPSQSSDTLGVCYFKSGYIYVGAKNYDIDYQKIHGTLAHEMCHFSMFLVYDNHCLPYSSTDDTNREAFNKVYDETNRFYETRPSITESLISRVFECYGANDQLAELIVRVPHILAEYKGDDKKISELKQDFCYLFDFFKKKVYGDIKRQCKLKDEKDQIKDINCADSLLTSIQRIGISLKDPKTIKASTDNEVKILTTNSSDMTLASIYQTCFKTIERNFDGHILLSVKFLRDKQIVRKVKDSLKSSSKPKLIIDCTNKAMRFEMELINFAREVRENRRLTLVMTNEEGLILGKKFSSNKIVNHVEQLCHSWQEFNDDVQKELIEREVNFQGFSLKCSELIPVSSKALIEIPLNDLLNEKSIKIGQALVDPSHKFFIPRSFRLRNNKSNDSGFDLQRLLAVGRTKKVVVISGAAGTGKSSALFEIATAFKSQNQQFWVSFVDLKKFVTLFEKLPEDFEVQSFEEFFLETILKNEKLFDREVCRELFTSGKALILFDGFDEISPNHKELVIKVVSSFKTDSTNQLWVTTRPHLELDLEEALKCTLINLSPLTEKDQIDFLVKYWQFSECKLKQSADEHEDKARILIRKLSHSSSSGLKFIGLPMLVIMLAKVYKDVPLELNMSLDLNFIYNQFICVLIKNWMSKPNQSDQENINMHRTNVIEIHYKLALKHFLKRRNVKSSLNYFNYDKIVWSDERIAKVGIIRFDSVTGSFQFLHETFAEYLVARFIFESFKACDLTVDLAAEILLVFTHHNGFQTIRGFLNQAFKNIKLQTSFQKLIDEAINKKIEELKIDDVLRFVVVEPHHNLVKFLLRSLNKENLRKILLHPIYFGSIAIHLATESNDVEMIWLICNAARNLTVEDRKKMFLQTRTNKQSVLHYAARNFMNENAFQTVWDELKGLLNGDEKINLLKLKDKFKNNLFHCAARRGNQKTVNDVLTAMKEYLTLSKIQHILLQKNCEGRISIHLAFESNTKESLENICQKVKKVFISVDNVQSQDVQRLFSETDPVGRSIFHFIAFNKDNQGVLTMLWNWLLDQQIFSLKELKLMLKHVDDRQFNILHTMIERNNPTAMSELFQIIKTLNFSERKKFLFDLGRLGKNSLQLAASESSAAVCERLLKGLKDLLDREEERLLFNNRCPHNMAIFHFAASNENNDVFKSLHDYILERNIFTFDEMKELLKEKDSESHNVFHILAKRNNEKAFDELLKLVHRYLKPSEIKDLLLDIDRHGNNCLHLAIRFDTRAVVDSFFKLIKTVLPNPEDQNALFKKRGFNNIFHFAGSNRFSEDVFPSIISHVSGILSDEEIKSLLLERNKDYSNFMHLLMKSRTCSEKAMNFVCAELLKKFMSSNEIKACLTAIDKDGGNVLHNAVYFNYKETVKILFDFIKESLDLEDQKSLKKSLGFNGMNIFQCAFFNYNNRQYGLVETLRYCLKDILTDEEINDIYRRFLYLLGFTNGILSTLIDSSDNKNGFQLTCFRTTVCQISNKFRR